MKGRRWTYNGIKTYYPNLSYSAWLKICAKGDNKRYCPETVVGSDTWLWLESGKPAN
jgi:hypothetical protein